MRRFLNTALLSAALVAPLALAPTALRAYDHDRDDDQARVYHDRDHNDDHHWDTREDRAYRVWVRDNHRRYENFDRLRDEDRAAYWNWRHEHSNEVLHIDVH
jgi:Ni/Co efflux regulator RcnB